MENKNKITPLIQNQKPQTRELTLRYGIGFPSDVELIQLILGTGNRQTPVEKLAEQVLNVLDTSPEDRRIENLMNISGIGKSQSLKIAAAVELGRRKTHHLGKIINQPQDIIPFVQNYTMESREHFCCVTISGAKEIMNIRVISIGTISRALIHPRELFADAITDRASGIICVHNHPFGFCQPSQADIDSTEAIRKASEIIGISLIDHIIITKNDYFSFREHGLLNDFS